MNKSHVTGTFIDAFKGIEPDENGRSVVTIKSQGSFYNPESDTYMRSSDISGQFSVNRSMVKGDGLFSAPAFMCFKDEMAQARFVLSRPDLYTHEFVKECEKRLSGCSSESVPSSCTSVSSSLQVQPPLSQTSLCAPSTQDRTGTNEDDQQTEPDASPALPSEDDSRIPGEDNLQADTSEPRET